MKTTIIFTLAILACAASAFAWQRILPDFHADPSARVFDDKLYIYPSRDADGVRDWTGMVDWDAFSTDNMEQWTDHGVAFGLKDISWADTEAWAPDCIERNGKYYFYFPADSQIGVAVSDSPVGPFEDALGHPLVERDEAGIHWMIDPCVFIDDDGQAYLYVGGAYKLAVVKLKEDMITRDGSIQILTMPQFYEGVWIHKRNGIYYASYPSRSSGGQANVMVYSMANSPLGPWEYKGEILDNHSLNVHRSITEFKDQWYLFYHVEGSSHWERHVCVAPLTYNGDGTIKPIQIPPSNDVSLPIRDGLVMHLDANSITGIADGAAISTWPGLSGAGNDATRATLGNQPTYTAVSSNFNGIPIVHFDGNDDGMALPASKVSVGSFTAFIVAKYNQSANRQYIMAGQDSGGDDRFRFVVDESGPVFEYCAGSTGWKTVTAPADLNLYIFTMTSTVEGFLDGVSLRTVSNTSSEWPTTLNLGSYNRGKEDFFNGQQVDYSEDSMTPAEFNITDYLVSRTYVLVTEVYRWCDGSFLNEQDMWHPCISRLFLV